MVNALEDPKTQAEAVMRAIRLDIVGGALKPGDRLGMQALQERYAVGVSPLREALSRLTALSLVTTEGQRGFRVACISEDDLLDLAKTAVWVECTAVRAAIARGDRKWEAEVVAAAHRLGIDARDPPAAQYFEEQWEEDHRALHRCILAACGASHLLGYRALLFEKFERYRRLSATYERGTRDVNREHRALVDSILRRDAGEAARLTQAHLLETTKNLLLAGSNTPAAATEKIKKLETEIALGQGAPP